MKKKAIELIRVSTEGQAREDRAGIPAQRASNRRTATQYGLEIVRTIEIADVSGAAVLRSPEMQELLRLIESADIHGVVAKEFSRLMRPENFADYALLQTFVDTATILYLPDGPVDFSSKSGRLFGVFRAAMAGHERTEILERVWAAKEEKRRAGKHPQSHITLPFGVGYESKTSCWYYTEDIQKVVEAFRLFLSGETSYVEVGRRVSIDPINLRYILRNPIYTGWRIYSKRRDPTARGLRVRPDGRQGDRRKINREPSEVIRVRVLEPMVSEIDFQRLQQILNLKKENHWRARPEHERRFTYSGFLRCGSCGNLIYTHSSKRREWYVCKSRTWPARLSRLKKELEPCTNPYMRRERMESSIDNILAERLTDVDFLKRLAFEYADRARLGTTATNIPNVKRKLKELEAKRQRLLDGYLDNLIDSTEFNRRLEKIKTEQSFYDEKLAGVTSVETEISAEKLAKSFEAFQEWMFLSRTDKRRLLQAIIPEIHVENYRVTKVGWLPPADHRDEMSHTGRGSWRRPA
jgi:DNA invertase Pin-like site-specific DNA recombinase